MPAPWRLGPAGFSPGWLRLSLSMGGVWGSHSLLFARQVSISLTSGRTLLKLPWRTTLRVRTGSRREVHVKARMFLPPFENLSMSVYTVVVHDQVQLQLLRRFPVELIEQPQPFDMGCDGPRRDDPDFQGVQVANHVTVS